MKLSRIFSKIPVLALLVSMLLALTPKAEATNTALGDVRDSAWYYAEVNYVLDRGLMTASSANPPMFSPKAPLSGEMLTDILHKLSDAQNPADAEEWIAESGIMDGVDVGANVTREQMAIILYNYAKHIGAAPQADWAIRLDFADLEEISNQAVESLMFCVINDIVTGKPGRVFDPKSAITRAETAAMLRRFLVREDIARIAFDAYVYALPLVIMDLTEKNITNVKDDFGAPLGQFYHIRRLSTHEDRYIVRPNIDTPYSHAYLDLSEEPVMFSKPETDIYSSIVVFDAYTNCVAILGTGGLDDGQAAVYALCGPDFEGDIPDQAVRIDIPTNMTWLLVRTDGEDLDKLRAIQDLMELVPLSEYENADYVPPKGTYSPEYDYVPLMKLMEMDIDTFFNAFNRLSVANPGTAADLPALQRFAEIGVGAGYTFDISSFTPHTLSALRKVPSEAMSILTNAQRNVGAGYFYFVNSWLYMADNIARFGTNYEFRAAIAISGIGANPVEMAVYPTATMDSDGEPLSGDNKYVIRFEKGQLPPCDEFWSITAYDLNSFLIDNPVNKYAVMSRDALIVNPDGSVDIYLQSESPGAELEANWLPVHNERFTLSLRIYQPHPSVLDRTWQPPNITKT